MAKIDFASAIHSKSFYCSGNTDVSTTSASYVDMPDMSLTFSLDKKSTCIIVAKIGRATQDSLGWPWGRIYVRLLIDNVEEDISMYSTSAGTYITAAAHVTIVLSKAKELSAGSHTVKVQWNAGAAGTAYSYGTGLRSISILVVPRR